LKYRSEIDGLRAVAVVPVILFHAGSAPFSGGFVGVDVFFVISGYLITTILIDDLEADRFSLVNFYERRARRILPALFFVMACCLPFAWMWMLPNQMEDFAKSILAVTLFVSNFLFWKSSGYFAAEADEQPLLHTWSLAVEEQYYLLFPIFLFLAWRFGKSRVYWMIVVFSVISIALAEWGWRNEPKANFFLIPTRAWELFAGSIAAFIVNKRGVQGNNALSLLGLAAIVYSILMFDEHTPFPSLYALAPVVGSVLIVLYADKDTLAAKLLSTKAFVGIGLVSYSAYLWHQPLLAFARIRSTEAPGQALMLGLAAASLVLAAFSWKYVEQPFRKRDRVDRKTIFSLSLAGGLVFVAIGVAGWQFSGRFEQHWLARQSESVRSTYAVLNRANPELSNFGADERGNQNLAECRFNTRNVDEARGQRILDCFEQHGPGVLIVGDSHAMDLYGVVASRFDAPFLIGITQGGCQPSTAGPYCHYDNVAAFVEANPEVFGKIIYEEAGVFLLREADGTKGSREMFSRLRLTDPVENIEPDMEHIAATLAYVKRLSETVPVLWFLPRAEPHIGKNYVLRNGCEGNYFFREGQYELFERLERVIRDAIDTARDDAGLQTKTWLSQNEQFAFDLSKDYMTCDDIYWSDGDHFSETGEVLFGKRLPDDFIDF